MPLFEVTIPQVTLQTVSVVAETEVDAKKKAEDLYGIPRPLRDEVDEFLRNNPQRLRRYR